MRNIENNISTNSVSITVEFIMILFLVSTTTVVYRSGHHQDFFIMLVLSYFYITNMESPVKFLSSGYSTWKMAVFAMVFSLFVGLFSR